MNLAQELLGTTFQNPVLLASGTCGYGEEFEEYFDIDRIGGLVTKAVTIEVREGNPAPRVAEYAGGMINSVGLANVGLAGFKAEKLPWLARRLTRARVLVNVAGRTTDEFAEIVQALDDQAGFHGYELNLSCPNVRDGVVFATRPDLIRQAVAGARAATRRPLVAKLAPNVPDIGEMAAVAVDAGADALTLINTFPGLIFDLETRRPMLGAGTGGVSGPAILPMGVHAVWQARKRVSVPIIGAGGIRTADDAMHYILAGASLVEIGTASFADPRAAVKVISGLEKWVSRSGAKTFAELVGAGR